MATFLYFSRRTRLPLSVPALVRGLVNVSPTDRIPPPPHLDPAYDQARLNAQAYFDSHGFDTEGRLEWPVAWGEMDICRHTNNVSYVRYMETNRMRWFETLQPDIGADMCRDLAQGTNTGMVANEQTIKYIRAVTYPDSLVWAARIHSIDQDKASVRMAHAAWSVTQDQLVCIGDVKGTLFNFNTNTRGVMTDDLKAVLESRIRPITAKPRVKSA